MWKINNEIIKRLFGEPINPIPSCDNCAWINMTEDQQESLRVLERHVPHHICTKYNKRVVHNSRSMDIYHDIRPCDECVNNNYIDFKDRRYFTVLHMDREEYYRQYGKYPDKVFETMVIRNERSKNERSNRKV